MKIPFVLRKKHDLLNEEYIMLNDKHEKLIDKYKSIEEDNKELDLKILDLNEECKLHIDMIKELEEENEKLKKANKSLKNLWNDANRKIWCNNESSRQLKKLSEEILEYDKINKANLSAYLYSISKYVGGGIPVETRDEQDEI